VSTASAELAISTRGLRKTYRNRKGRHVAVQGLDLDVPVGGVHGFLGPNGSGKTTSIRMLLGLVRPDAGTMHSFGTEVPRGLPDVVGRVGAIVEEPKFFPSFSGRENLVLLADAIGAPRTRVDAVLEETALGERGKDRFRSYSLGMKQRLAIAATLLKTPDLLIFDEPTNGLDPAGTRDVRQIIAELHAGGATVVLSSHLLAEVEATCTHVAVLQSGSLVATGELATLLDAGTGGLVVSTPDVATALDALRAAGATAYRAEGPEPGVVVADGPPAPEIVALLVRAGVAVHEARRRRANLEELFARLTEETS
jgi:ABC-2 type transport system ATP-binding protein